MASQEVSAYQLNLENLKDQKSKLLDKICNLENSQVSNSAAIENAQEQIAKNKCLKEEKKAVSTNITDLQKWHTLV